MAGKCAYHPEVEAVSGCVGCGRLICLQCRVVLEGKTYCSRCANEISLGKTAAKPEVDKGPAERYQALNARLVSARETQEGIAYLFEKTDCASLASSLGSFFAAEGYKLEEGTPQDGVYGKGSGARRIIFGGLAQRYRFRFRIYPESKLVCLDMAKGMSGVSGGVMGYQALNSEFERIQAKLTAGSGVVPGGISRPVAAPVEEPAPAALVGQPVATRRPVVAGGRGGHNRGHICSPAALVGAGPGRGYLLPDSFPPGDTGPDTRGSVAAGV
jgi:hypothetical protein